MGPPTSSRSEAGGARGHREGHLIPADREIRIPEALELIRGDYEVVRQPTFYPVDAAFQLRQSKHAYVTIRTDTGKELGSVGRSYTVLQNAEAFRAMEPLLGQGVVRLETGGVLRPGADVWLLGRFDVERFGPVVREVFADEVVPYCLFTNNHSGRRTACVALTPIRVVCANTLGYAERRGDKGKDRMIKVSHTGDAA
jgi:phage/plasmid-like protein (TIGR03299 family)